MTRGPAPLPTREPPAVLARPAGLALLGVLLLLSGAASVLAGTDRNWDLQNYHVYAPHAWLQGRLFRDVGAGQIQGYFNPLMHLPWYGALRLLMDWPRVFAFLNGLPAGLLAYLYLRIAHAHAAMLLDGAAARLAAVGAAALLGLTGAAFVPGIGLSSADVWVAVPLMAAYGLILRAAIRRGVGEAPDWRAMALAGLLAGMATGLKLTSLPFAAALGIMLLLVLGLRAALVAGAAMALGFLLCWAPHAWTLWRETGNPTFPLNNAVFRSPDWLPRNFLDTRFLPRSALQGVFYPFWWLDHTSGMVSELRMRDWRMAIAFVAVLLAIPPVARGEAGRGTRAAWLLLGTCALSYAGWAALFGIYRYLVFLEVLASLAVLLALALLMARRAVPVVAATAALGVLALSTTAWMNWGHGRHGARIIEVPPLPVTRDALVVTTDGEPYGYLVAFLPPEATILGLRTNFMQPGEDHGLARRLRARLAAHDGPVWAIHAPGDAAGRDAALAGWGLQLAGECRVVATSLAPGGHSFCPVRKRG